MLFITCFDGGMEERDAAALPRQGVGTAPLLLLLLELHLRRRGRHQVLLAVGRHRALPRPVENQFR